MHGYVRAIRYFRNDARLIAGLLVLVAASIGLGLLQAWPAAILIDAVLTPTPHADWIHRLFLAPLPNNRLAQVIGIAIIGMAMKFAQDTIWMLRAMLNNRIKYNGVARVRGQLFQKLNDLGPAYHQQRPQGDSIYRVSSDAWGIFGILDTFIATSIAAVTLVVMIGIMLGRNIPLTIFAISIAPLLIAVNIYFGRRIRGRSTESKQIDADFTTVTQRAMASMGLIAAFGRQRREMERFNRAVENSNRAMMRLNWQEQLYPLAVNVIYAIGGAIVFGYGGYLVLQQQFVHPIANPLTCGDLMVFMAYLGGLWDPLRCLTGFTASIQGHAAAIDRVYDVLDRAPQTPEPANPIELMPGRRVLSLEKVSFGYTAKQPVLRGISVTISPGEMVAFVGPSGAGKSTLIQLLARLYDPDAGTVRLDGCDLRQLSRNNVHRHIALVPQDSPLLAASIAENIAYGRPDATARDIRAAAALAGADDFIEALPDGYDTVLADNATNFSGGQRQRLAIARALLTEAPILVLDEPTSAQDPLHERQIMSTLYRIRGSRMIILVTHRLETISTCDQIVVMEEGAIVERGTHLTLLAGDGLYARMLAAGKPTALAIRAA